MSTFSLFLFFLLFSFFFVDCSVEEINKLRSEWREKLNENNELMNEVKKLKDDIVIENSFFSSLSLLKNHLITLTNFNKDLLVKEEDVKEPKIKTMLTKKEQLLKELMNIKTISESKFNTLKDLLLIKEREFEQFWENKYFIKSIEFILKQSLLVPIPKFPKIYNIELGDKKVIAAILVKRSELIELEGELVKTRKEKLKEINKKIFEIENEFKKFNSMQIIHDNFEMLKRNVLAMKFKEEAKKTKLLDLIGLYQNTQTEVVKFMEMKYLNDSTIKLKRYIDFLLSGDKWKLRLGPIKPIESPDATTAVTKSPFLIQNKITSVSRLASDLRARQSDYIKLIKYNAAEKMKYVALIGERKIYKFIVKKYARIVQDMHKYMVKADEKVVKGIYQEVIDDLVSE